MNENEIPIGYTRVTQVLQPYSNLGKLDPEIVAKAADRGSRVHTFCELHALGLFVAEVDDDCKNYFEVFKRWYDEYVDGLIFSEQRLNSKNLKLSGQIDLLVRLKGDVPDIYTIVDIKTPATPSVSWRLQTAAYKILADELLDISISRRICLLLPKNGDVAKIVEYSDHEKDMDLFLKALELYRIFE